EDGIRDRTVTGVQTCALPIFGILDLLDDVGVVDVVYVEPVVTDIDHTNIVELVKDADLILDGTDNFEIRYLINDAAVKLNKPWRSEERRVGKEYKLGRDQRRE